MSSSSSDRILTLNGKVFQATKEEFKAALETAKKGADLETEWQNALQSDKEHTTVTSPTDQKTFQILTSK